MLRTAYPTIRDFLDFMLHFAANSTHGLVHPDGFDWLGDWQAPHGCSDGNDPDLYNNAYIVYALKRAVEIVDAIADESVAPRADRDRFDAGARRIGAAAHSVFYNTATGRYGPTNGVGMPRQGHQVLALAAGIPPSRLIPVVFKALVDELTNVSRAGKGHIDTGLHTTYFMGKILAGGMEQQLAGADSDRPDLIYFAMMNPTWPSYSALIDANLTTWPETWAIGKVAGGVSKMHGTLNGFGLVFVQAFLGVQRPFGELQPNTTRFRIRPSYFIPGKKFSPPAPTSPPSPPSPRVPCLGGIVGECGSSPTGKCTPERQLHITCKPGTGTITAIEVSRVVACCSLRLRLSDSVRGCNCIVCVLGNTVWLLHRWI
jgi:hypothetical protein